MIPIAKVIIPLAAPKAYSYKIPEIYQSTIAVGMRVEVQFGNHRIYSGIVLEIAEVDDKTRLKPIISLLDETPIVHPHNMEFWQWIADYYMCTIGEVMLAALPNGLKMSSETVIIRNPEISEIPDGLSDQAYLLAEALSIQNRLRLDDARKILDQNSVIPIFHELVRAEFAYVEEEMKERYKPKLKKYIQLQPEFRSVDQMNQLFELCSRSEKQTRVLLAYFQLSRNQHAISQEELIKAADADSATIKALIDKRILIASEKQVSRVGGRGQIDDPDLVPLSSSQMMAFQKIKLSLGQHKPCLLRGVTGSGKTRIYQELISIVLKAGGQILYLLPEISLTTQMEQRLREQYGEALLVYHSKQNNNNRVEIWKKIYHGHQLVVGARSALLLPFSKLQLIIVDEEHDPSYKQQDPNPRYHGRDAALFLAMQLKSGIVLGSATPSIESMQHASSDKYTYVELLERYGDSQLPTIELIDMPVARKAQRTVSFFSQQLLDAIEQALNRKERIILFQNRRGYAPILECDICKWKSECIHCDVSLTYHKFSDRMKCHYCGFENTIPEQCPDCGSRELKQKGFGTEKIEDELMVFFPDAKIARMDADTMKSKAKLEQLLENFKTGKVEILVGTQMLTKGFDFDNVGLVGVLSADQSLYYPDFRAGERTFQLITQVSGRSGRREKQGLVLIQSDRIEHPVIQEIISNDFNKHFKRELNERAEFGYPPFKRLIQITIKHQQKEVAEKAAYILSHGLKGKLADRILGPAPASVPRVNNKYIFHILLKLEKNAKLITESKDLIERGIQYIKNQRGLSTVRISVDVDPI
jgi:primosomal protein N' (replication factor Y)